MWPKGRSRATLSHVEVTLAPGRREPALPHLTLVVPQGSCPALSIEGGRKEETDPAIARVSSPYLRCLEEEAPVRVLVVDRAAAYWPPRNAAQRR